jgi:hypothetical protein
MAYEPGDIKVFNPNKEISKEITLEILIRHRDALKQARTGELPGIPMDKIKDNDRKIYQVRALNLIIAAQREMITTSRPIIWFRSMKKWEKKFKKDKEREANPFSDYESDYKKLIEWLDILRECENAILEADRTKSKDDDFMIVKQKTEGDFNELTQNFYEMLEDLESTYEQIYLLMLTNKIVSAGIEEDEEMNYKEKEAEAIRRVVEA